MRFNFLSFNGKAEGSSGVDTSSVDMVTAKSVRCLTTPSRLVLRFFGVTFGVAFGVVLLEALETLRIKSVRPVPVNLENDKCIIIHK